MGNEGENQIEAPSLKNQIFKVLNTMKVMAIMIFLIICWTRTNSERENTLDVIHLLSKRNLINITYHHDVLVGNNSYNSDMTDTDTNLT